MHSVSASLPSAIFRARSILHELSLQGISHSHESHPLRLRGL